MFETILLIIAVVLNVCLLLGKRLTSKAKSPILTTLRHNTGQQDERREQSRTAQGIGTTIQAFLNKGGKVKKLKGKANPVQRKVTA